MVQKYSELGVISHKAQGSFQHHGDMVSCPNFPNGITEDSNNRIGCELCSKTLMKSDSSILVSRDSYKWCC